MSKLLKNTCNKCRTSWTSASNLFPSQLHFLGVLLYIISFFHSRPIFSSTSECFSFMFFFDCSVSDLPRTLSHLMLTIYLKLWRASKSNRNSCWKMFLQVVVPEKLCRHFGKLPLPQWSLLVPPLIGNMELFLLFQMFVWEFSQVSQTQKQLSSGAIKSSFSAKICDTL